jgi:hypothetical protein
MTASLKIDQTGLAAGSDGLSRTDGLSNGAEVTLTSVTVGTTYEFELLWVPHDDVDAVSSLAQSGSPEVWTFTPTADVYGTYRIKLTVDEGLATEETVIRIFGIRNLSGVLIPAFNEKADEDASLILAGADQISASENNETSDLSGLQYTGWWNFFAEIANALESINLTTRIKQSFNEQASDSPEQIGTWKLSEGTLKAGSSVYMGSSTGTHQVTARLRRVADPVPIVAEWQLTGGLQEDALASDADIPADGWYYLEIFSGDAAASVIFDGVDFELEQDAL